MYGIENNIYAKDTGVYGKSLFAKRDFEKDEVVFVAYGPIIEETNLYTIPVFYNSEKDQLLHIEPREPDGNLSQYICHSCEPNLGIKNRTVFTAMSDIQQDSEVTIDYAMIIAYFPEQSWVGWEGWKCTCGRKTCRGQVCGYYQLADAIKKKYSGYVSDVVLEMENSKIYRI